MARRQICAETVVSRRPDLMMFVMALHWRGYVLSPHARVITRRDGAATIRLVWRDRAAGEAITLTLTAAEPLTMESDT